MKISDEREAEANSNFYFIAAFLAQTISLDDNTTVKFEIW